MRIRTRLLITSILLFAAGSYWLVDWILQDFRYHYFMTMEESMVDSSTTLAALVAQQTEDKTLTVSDEFRAGMAEASSRDLRAKIYDFTKTNMNLRVLVTDKTGLVVFDSLDGKDEGEDYSNWRDIRLTLAGEYGARATKRGQDDPDNLTFFVASPILVEGEILGALSVGKPSSSILPFMRKAKSQLIVTGITAVSAVLLLQVLVSFWVTRPIHTLIAYARAIRDGRKVTKPRLNHSEMGDLASAFEEMRDSLEGRKYVERYVQTLTHEMKSPLSAIQGASELLSEEMPDEQRARFLKNIRSEARRIHDLIDRLLALVGVEKRKEIENIESINISALIQDVITSMQPLLQQKQISMALEAEDSVQLSGETFLLRQAFANLIQNAIDFSPEGGPIHITVKKEDSSVQICVRDEGPGIPDYAVDRLFERFYSLPRPDHGKKSSGLGLNFVREIVTLHGGTITLKNHSPHGAEARLILPANAKLP